MRGNFVTITPNHTTGKTTILPVEAHYSKRKVGNGFCSRLWHSLITRLAKEPDTYVIFPGDMIDADRPSTRERKEYDTSDRKEAHHEEDDYHRYFLEKGIIEDLRPVKHKIIGMVDGDHFVKYANGRTSTQHIAQTLGIPQTYLGERMGWVVLNIRRKSHEKDQMNFKIFIRHGKGSYTTIGADINGLIRQSSGFIADLYIGGHTHKKWVHSVPFLDIGKTGRIVEKPIGWARSGSLLRGFPEGQTTYAEVGEFSPLHVGYPDVYIYTGRGDNDAICVKEIRGLS